MKQVTFVCIVCMIFALAFGGCVSVPNSPTPRFYTLQSISDSQATRRFDMASGMIIGIGPVRIPEYLNRPQIVTQGEDKMLKFAEFDRWGETLDLALTRLISEDLMVMLPGASIEAYPWNTVIPVKYQVLADVVKLESDLEEDLSFMVQWSLIDWQNNKMLFMRRSKFRKPISPQSYSGLVETLSMACASLSEEIAEAVANLAAQPEKK